MKKFYSQLPRPWRLYFSLTGGIAVFCLLFLMMGSFLLSLLGLQFRSAVCAALIVVSTLGLILLTIGAGLRCLRPLGGKFYMIFVNFLRIILFCLFCGAIYIMGMLGLSFTMQTEEVAEWEGQKYVQVLADLGGEKNEMHRYYGSLIMGKDWFQRPDSGNPED